MTEAALLRSGRVFSRLVSGVALVLALVLGGLAPLAPALAAGAPLCTPFAEGSAGLSGWGACSAAPNIVVTTTTAGNMSGDGSDYYLRLRDTAGPSAACSTSEQYLGDWNGKMGECGSFCFDFKVFRSGTPPGPVTPSFSIWNGTLRASFVANFTVTTDDPWVHICAPVNLVDPGENLPAGASGEWRIAPTGNAYSPDWNTIITNVTMVQLPIDFTSDPSEEAGYDNFCMNPGECDVPPPPPVLSGCFKDGSVEIACNGDGTFTLTLSAAGSSGSEISLGAETAGITVSPPLQPWAATTTWTVSGATPGAAVTLFATLTAEGMGSEAGTDSCCSGEITFVAPDCPETPPDIKVEKTVTLADGPDHRFELVVTNVGAPITYGPGEISVADTIPAGMTVLGVSAPGWTCVPLVPPPLSGPATLTCTNDAGGSAATGAPIGSAIALDTTSTVPGLLTNCAEAALAPDLGTDVNPDDNTSCVETKPPQDGIFDLGIEKTGGTSPPPGVPYYGFHLTVTNHGSPFAGASTVVINDVVPPGMVFDSATGSDWSCNAPPTLTAGQTLTCTYIGTGTIGTGDVLGTIDVSAHALGEGPFPPVTNCADVEFGGGSGLVDSDASNDNDCVTVSKPETNTHDIGVEKTGTSMPGPVGAALSYTLTVTSTGAPFTGTNDIIVTDSVPAGVTISSAGGTDWDCQTLPVTGPASFTCTYIGGGPFTAGEVLPPISVSGLGTGDGPYLNCAETAFDPLSGLHDSDPGNDESCVSVPGNEAVTPPPPPPLVCDPTTAKPGVDGCICLYDKMTQSSPTACECPADSTLVPGRGCVTELVCKAPLVANSKGTACVCPGITILKNGKCVTPETKKPTKLTCAQGTTLNKAGSACIPVPSEPKKPTKLTCPKGATLNKAGTACIVAPKLPKITLPKGVELPDLGTFFSDGTPKK